jgi:hypothetical protein
MAEGYLTGRDRASRPSRCAWAVRDLQRPRGRDGLFFQALNGDARVVSPAAIAETFGAVGGSVRLVVLSACYGEIRRRRCGQPAQPPV